MAYVNTSVGTADTDADMLVPELWAKSVFGYIQKKMVLSNLVDTSFSSLVKEKGDVIHIPKVSAESATTTTPVALSGATENITYTSPNDGEVQLSINKLSYVAKIISDIAKIQASPELLNAYTKNMGYAIAGAIEDFVHTTISGASGASNLDLGTANTFADSDLSAIVSKIGDLGLDAKGMVFALHPYHYGKLYALDEFTSRDYRSDAPVQSGIAGTLLGMPVVVSNEFGTGTPSADAVVGALWHPENVKLAYQQTPKVVSQYSVDFLGNKVAVWSAYGGAVLNGNQVILINEPAS